MTKATFIILAALASAFAALAGTPPASPDLLNAKEADFAKFKTEKNPVLTRDTSSGSPALKVMFPGGSAYPGVDLPVPTSHWDLSAYAGVEAEISNLSQEKLNLSLRIDNPGDWSRSPWNTNNVWLAPGETQRLQVVFGQSFGNAAYPLDPSRISNLKLFAADPTRDSAILVKSVRAFGTAEKKATPASPTITTDATFSPPISGELLDLGKSDALASLKHTQASSVIEGAKLKVTFNAASDYPNIQFPIPSGGWNLDAFGGIEVTVTNPHDRKIDVFLRVDNPGDWKTEPWNTEKATIEAGTTQTVTLTFGQQNGAPAFPLNSKRISAIQIFIEKHKADTTLILSGLKATGSPAATLGAGALTSPADREIPVTPPPWLGERPPVDGEWVQTLSENFDGDRLNDQLWTPRFPWDGPQPGQLQRYVPENVIVGDGFATFKVEKRHGHENNDPARDTRDYTSGLIQSYDKWAQLYGYFEARVKLPAARGLWPAFWMMPDRGRDSGYEQWKRRDTGDGAMEIDILEHLTEWGPGRNNVALHWDGYGSDHKSWGTSHIYFGPTPDGWHHFGLLWEPGKLTWFIDGKKVAEYENDRISKVPSYLKLNVQMGGWATHDIDDSKLPDHLRVDHVRAWQLKNRL